MEALVSSVLSMKATPSIKEFRLTQRSPQTKSITRSRCGPLGAEKGDRISGSLSQSKALQQLSSRSDSRRQQPPRDVVEENTLEYDNDSDIPQETLKDFGDLEDFDEGWSTELVDAPDVSDLDEDEDQIDFQSDPMFSSLSAKSIALLERQLQKQRQEKEKEKELDESSLSTRTQAKPHRLLRIISGEFKGRRLLSPRGRFVRPMMERVRAAIFDMLFGGVQGSMGFPPECRWLDLYAGTGSVGLEAMSRGCEEVLFVEKDPWVASSILKQNVEDCNCTSRSSIRVTSVEGYLDGLIRMPEFRSGPFDFISVCPPYLQVSYPELQDRIEDSGILHDQSIIFMEYPKQLKNEIRDAIGGLRKIKDRQYGRTYLAVYGPNV